MAVPGMGPAPSDNRQREQSSLRQYLEVVARRWKFVLLSIAVCGLGALLYVATADKVYEATADMLVTPVSDEQSSVLGLGLIRRASDPTRDVTTAARLIGNIEVARDVRARLGGDSSPQQLLNRISVDPVAQSSIVAITASGPSPQAAQDLANAFAEAAVAERTVQLHRELDPAIERLRGLITDLEARSSPEVTPLYEQVAALESLRSAPDPTLRVETIAAAPTAPVSPRGRLSLIGGLFAGLLFGVAGAFALNALDSRPRREDQFEALGLPVLARVPRVDPRGSRHGFEEAFRFLRTMIRFASPAQPYATIAVTSASERDGKTTTAFQLAFAALEAGQTVILVEADPYRPALRRLVQTADTDTDGPGAPGLLDHLAERAALDDIIQPTTAPGLDFVPAGALTMESITGLLEQQQGRGFVEELADRADLVILDCPPIGPRSDAVILAAAADAVMLVVDIKESSEDDVDDAVRRLRGAKAELIGVVVNRDDSARAEYEYRPLGEAPPVKRDGDGGARRRPTATAGKRALRRG